MRRLKFKKTFVINEISGSTWWFSFYIPVKAIRSILVFPEFSSQSAKTACKIVRTHTRRYSHDVDVTGEHVLSIWRIIYKHLYNWILIAVPRWDYACNQWFTVTLNLIGRDMSTASTTTTRDGGGSRVQ